MKRLSILTMLLAWMCTAAVAQPKARVFADSHKTQTTFSFSQVEPFGTPSFQTRRAEEVIVNPPAGLVTENYTFTATYYDGSNYNSVKRIVNIGFNDSDVYLQGFCYNLPDAWIKGTVDAGKTKLSFDSPQLYGYSGTTPLYFIYMMNEQQPSYPTSMELDYDAATGSITIPATTVILEGSQFVNAYKAYGLYFSVKLNKGAELPVTAPEDLVTEEYGWKAKDLQGNDSYGSVKIGFDGADVYVQGLTAYYPEGWIKGTREGNKITFVHNQFLGTLSDSYDMYFNYNLNDAVFTYNDTEGTLTLDDEYVAINSEEYTFNYYAGLVIRKAVEQVATPATPFITQIYQSQSGDEVVFSVPTIDTEGNPLVTSKLSFQFFYDIEKTVTPLTFQAGLYSRIKESMTAIPFGFTDNYDFYPTEIYLNMDHADWNKIGIQSIYTGGGEEKKSDIFWYSIQGYSNGYFDFNEMDVATSSSNSHDGDITTAATLTSGKVTLAVSPSGNSETPNCFWNTTDGPQLRLYGGTLTFTTTEDKTIKKITFDNAEWNTENSADKGEFDGAVWTGDDQKVVVTIAGNTQINNITVELATFRPKKVEVPEGLTTTSYMMEFSYNDFGKTATAFKEVFVGHVGNDWYIQGLSDYVADGWVMGTMENNVLTLQQCYLGQFRFWTSVLDIYFLGATLNYDEATNTFTSEKGFKTVDDGETTYDNFFQLTLSPIVERVATPKAPTCEFGRSDYGSYYMLFFDLPLVDTDNQPIMPSKLNFIVKFERMGQVFDMTFTKDRFKGLTADMKEIPYYFEDPNNDISSWQIYLSKTNDDFVNEMKTWSRIGVQSVYYGNDERKESEIGWFNLAQYWQTQGITDLQVVREATESPVYNLAGQRQQGLQKGLNIVGGKKIFVR